MFGYMRKYMLSINLSIHIRQSFAVNTYLLNVYNSTNTHEDRKHVLLVSMDYEDVFVSD